MSGGRIGFDTVLDLCSDRHRRIVLAVLAEERRALTLNDLTKVVFRYESRAEVTEAPGAELARIRRSLHHRHVPKLASAEVVEYDSERKIVEPTERFDQLRPALSAIIDADPALEAPAQL